VPRVLPLHAPCGIFGLGEELDPGLFICATRRNWEHSTTRDTLGCGMLFPLCYHGQRGCLCCHRNEPVPGQRDRVLALVFQAHRNCMMTHDAYQALRASLAEIVPTPEALSGVADRIAREAPPASIVGRGAREIVAALAAMPRAA
jgi:hypothetical protein